MNRYVLLWLRNMAGRIEPDDPAAAAILYTLTASVEAGTVNELHRLTDWFAKRQIAILEEAREEGKQMDDVITQLFLGEKNERS